MSFNVVIHSDDYFSTTDAFNAMNQIYTIDWSFMEEGEYDLTFSFRTQHLLPFDLTRDIGTIECPDLAVFNSFRPTVNTDAAGNRTVLTQAITSSTIGKIRWVECSNQAVSLTKLYSVADWGDNPPVRVRKPQSNMFTVKLNDVNGNIATATSGKYVLILHFEKVKCCDH